MNVVKRWGPYVHKHLGYKYYVDLYSDGSRKTVYEHRVVAEAKLGRKLGPGECTHHSNEQKVDNRPENLVVTTVGEHTKHHHKKPEMITVECGFCGIPFAMSARNHRSRTKYGYKHFYCGKSCLVAAKRWKRQ